jgi:hypothetical protein
MIGLIGGGRMNIIPASPSLIFSNMGITSLLYDGTGVRIFHKTDIHSPGMNNEHKLPCLVFGCSSATAVVHDISDSPLRVAPFNLPPVFVEN